MAVEFRFGRFTLDSSRRELRCGSERIPLEPSAYRILAHLIEHRDRAVSRGELMQAVWPDVHVSPSSLYTAMYQLRGALRAADPSCAPIETLRGYGFLFAEPVVVEDSAQESTQTARDAELLAVYGAMTRDGLWCFELERPLRVSLPEPALLDAVLEQAKLRFCNASMAATYGYADPSELIGRPLTDFLVADRPENLAYLRELIRRRSVSGAISVEVDRTGARRLISNDVTCVVQGDEVLRVCGMQRDVTTSKATRGAARKRERRGPDLVGALLEIQRLSQAALASLASGEASEDAWLSLSEAHQRASQLRRRLE
jgi:DNA-binding winged helix-turn-helix (wHTH) protein